MPYETLLTSPLSDQEKAIQKERDERLSADWDRMDAIGEIIVEAFLLGEISPEKALQFYYEALDGFCGSELEGRGERGKATLFYRVAKQVYSRAPKQASKNTRITKQGVPTPTLRKLVAQMVQMAVDRDGCCLSRDREIETHAYNKVRAILLSYGLDFSVNSIHDCYQKYREPKSS